MDVAPPVTPAAPDRHLPSGIPPARVLAPSRRPPPPECFELCYANEALRVRDRAIVVQFVGASGGEGTTTVASGFARAAGHTADPAAPAGGASSPAVLYVDCGFKGPAPRESAAPHLPSLSAAFLAGSPLVGAIAPVRDAAGVYWAWLGAADARGTPRCGPAGMARLFEALRARFSVVVLDCPAVSRGVGAPSYSPHCDGTVLVVRAKRTSAAAVGAARDRIERFGGRVIGTVFNRSRRPSRWFGGRHPR